MGSSCGPNDHTGSCGRSTHDLAREESECETARVGLIDTGFVNWLTTHLNNAVGQAAVMRNRARIAIHEGHEICRVDVARSSRPVWAKTSKENKVFYVRILNTDGGTLLIGVGDIADRWEG